MYKRLKEHSQANCYVQIELNYIRFISYTTTVIEAYKIPDTDLYNISCSGTYSQTTRRQISWFLKEYFNKLNYYDMKDIAGKKLSIIIKRSC